MSEKNMITSRKALPQTHAEKTSAARSLDIKERYEERVNSLLLYLKQIGLQAIVLTYKEFNKPTESITNWKDTKSSNKRHSVLPIVNRVVKEGKAQVDTAGDEDGGGKKKDGSLINECSDRRISVICFPLASKKRGLGVHLANGPQGFRENDLLFITNRRSHAALAIENILLREKERGSKEALVNARDELERKVKERTSELMKANRKLKELAITDDLTGLFNHRHFLRELESEYRRALRYGRSLALLLLDVDHFKILNDRYGHSCGDFVLKNLAGLLKGCLRSADKAVRYGGDELAIILPETNKSKAWEVAEKLRRELEENPFEWDSQSLKITCSIGVAAVPDQGIGSWHSLLESADKCLYRAKGEGRNTVIVFNSCRGRAGPKNRQSRRQQGLQDQYLDLAPV